MKHNVNLNNLSDEVYQLESYVHQWKETDHISAIEKDIVLKKLQLIYEQVRLISIDSVTETPISAETPHVHIPHADVRTSVESPPISEKPVFKEFKEIEMEEKPEPPLQELIPTPEVIELPEVAEIPNTAPQETSGPELPSITEAEPSKLQPKEILAEKLSQPHTLINESIAKDRRLLDLSSKLKNTPITSIQTAINLNDKFLFIRELFKNNSLLYNQTLERLNTSANYTEAMAIVEKEFAWDMNDPLVSKLVELINRRYNV